MALDDCVESDVIFKWTHCCRLCLSHTTDAFDLFDPGNDDKCKSICLNLDLLVYRGDPMPRMLCQICWGKIDSWLEFRAKCMETEASLKQKLICYKGLDFVQEFLSKDDAIKDTLKSKSPESTTQLENPSKDAAETTNRHYFGLPVKKELLDATDAVTEPVQPPVQIKTERPDPVEVTKDIPVDVPMNAPEPVLPQKATITVISEERLRQPVVEDQLPVKYEATLSNPANLECTEDLLYTDELSDLALYGRGYNLRPRTDIVVNYNDNVDPLDAMEWQEAILVPKPVHRKLTPWQCSACECHFQTIHELQLHQDSADCTGHELEKHVCRVCSRLFFDEKDLAQHNVNHLRIAHNLTHDQLKPCGKCDRLYADQKRFNMHLKTHLKSYSVLPSQGETRAGPPNTTDEYETRSLNEPTVISAKESISCSLCSERFRNEDLLYDHRFAVHGIADTRVGCPTCYQRFRSSAELEAHEEVHQRRVARKSTSSATKSANGIPCRRCRRRFATRELLMRHSTEAHSKHRCRKCGRRFPTRSTLLIHARTHYVKAPQTPALVQQPETPKAEAGEDKLCKICDIRFEFPEDIAAHLKGHDGFVSTPGRIRHVLDRPYSFQCSKCPQLFVEFGSLPRHRQFRHSGLSIQFIRLKKTAYRAGASASSVWLFGKEKNYSCVKCFIKFSSRAVLNFHMKKKHGILPESTENTSEPEDNQEMKSVDIPNDNASAVNQGLVHCDICSKPYSLKFISKHMAYNHGVSNQVAKTSRKSNSCFLFSRKKALKCRFCPKTCTTEHNLRTHELSHDNPANELKCPTCDVSFFGRSQLQSHSRNCRPAQNSTTASVTPTYAAVETCNVCFHGFDSPQLLQLHISTAHGLGSSTESPAKELWREEKNKIIRNVNGVLRCTLCRLRFDNNEEVTWHQGQHARGNAYIIQLDECLFQCTVCGKLFKQRESGLSHISDHAEPEVTELSENGKFSCPFCNQKFQNQETIRKHIHSYHNKTSSNNKFQ